MQSDRPNRPKRTLSATARPSIQPTVMDSPPLTPDVVIVGTSLVRGLGARLSDMETDATCYTYPGQEIPHIRERISHIFSADYQPSHVIIQCGGNDADRHPPHQVVREYAQLVKEVRQICPQATISFSNIPKRRTDELTLVNISKISAYISNRGKRGDGFFSVNLCPSDRRHFSKDLIHFNDVGSDLFARNLATYCQNFHHRLQKS